MRRVTFFAYAGDVHSSSYSQIMCDGYTVHNVQAYLHVPVVSLRHNPELQYRNLSTVVTCNFKVVPGTPVLYYLKRIELLERVWLVSPSRNLR